MVPQWLVKISPNDEMLQNAFRLNVNKSLRLPRLWPMVGDVNDATMPQLSNVEKALILSTFQNLSSRARKIVDNNEVMSYLNTALYQKCDLWPVRVAALLVI